MKLPLVLAAAGVVMLGAASAHASILLSDSFSYPDGDLVGATGSPWVHHSGTTTLTVSGGELVVTGANSEDAHADLSGAPYNTGTLYAGFDVTVTAQPTGTTYFAHFYNNSSTFRGKLFAVAGSDANSFQFALSNNASSTPPVNSGDLALNTMYHVVVALNTNDPTTGVAATLYIDPTSETGGLLATDSTTATDINAYAFRQSGGEGDFMIDNLVVATTFAEANGGAVPEPASLGLLGLGALALLRRRR